MKNLGGQLAELAERLSQMRSEVYDIAEIVRDLKEDFEFSPAELDALESRADQLYPG